MRLAPVEPPATEGAAASGLDLRLAGAAAGVWAVSWCCLTRSPFTATLAAVISGVGLAAVLVVRRPMTAAVALILLGIVAGATSTGLRTWARDDSPLAALARQQASVTIWLVVTDDPRPVSRPSSYGRPALVLGARATRVVAAGRSYALGGRVLVLGTDSKWAGLLPSQHLRTQGRLTTPRGGDLTVAVLSARGPPADVSSRLCCTERRAPCEAACGRHVRDCPRANAGCFPAWSSVTRQLWTRRSRRISVLRG